MGARSAASRQLPLGGSAVRLVALVVGRPEVHTLRSVLGGYPAGVIHELERLLDPSVLTGLTARPIDQLRRVRVECTHVEGDVSLVRRIAQGRLDIVGHETRRRAGDESAEADVPGLLFDLPDLMTDEPSGSGVPGGRSVQIGEPGAVAGALVEQLDAMASPADLGGVDQMTDEQLRELFERIRAFEVELSSVRRQLHERIDAIQSEIGRRYRDGEASVDSVLG